MDALGFDLSAITEETLQAARKATSGILVSTGVQGVDLTGLVSLIPVNTPFRNSLSRVTPPMGAKVTSWRALTNVNSSQPNAATQFDFAGGLTQFNEQDVFAPYAPLELVATITLDSIDVAKDYADALAIGTLQNLNQVMISEDKNLIGSMAFALSSAPTPTVVQSDTGGSIAASSQVHVKIAARSGNNYFYGGSQAAGSDGTVTTSSVAAATHSATATWTSVAGAVAYDVFVGSTSGNHQYYTTVTTNSVTITTVPGTPQALPSLPLLSTVAPTTPPTADTSFQTYWMNGLIASIIGDYGTTGLVTRGSGTNSGSYVASNDNAQLTINGHGITELDALNLSLWNTAQLSPSRYLMNARQAQDITELLLGGGRYVGYVQPDDAGQRSNIVGGAYVNRYLNAATGGTPIAIEVHPHIPPGTIIAVTDKVPYPGANIDSVLSVRCLRDYYAYEYAANRVANTLGGGPRHDVAVRSMETFVNRAPVACGIIQNVANGHA